MTSCATIDLGDGSDLLTYGPDATTCNGRSIAGALTNPLVLTHAYKVKTKVSKAPTTLYTINFSGWDAFGNVSTQAVAFVSTSVCAPPTVSIVGQAPFFYAPLVANRSVQLDLLSNTTVACSESLNNQKNWSVVRLVDDGTGIVDGSVDVGVLPSWMNAQLTIPPLFLAVGLYRFTYRVSMVDIGVYSEAATYVRVVPSPLVAFIVANGMSTIERGWNTTVTLSPVNYSVDPDVDPNADQVGDARVQ